MVASVLTALDWDDMSARNQIVLVEENSTADGSFVVSSLVEQELGKNHKILILLFHNAIGHYRSIGHKLGYDLLEHEKSGKVVVFDFANLVSKHIKRSGENILEMLCKSIAETVSVSQNENVTLFVEHVSDLLLLGFSARTLTGACQSFRRLLFDFKNLSISVLIHNFTSDCNSQLLANYWRHFAHLSIVLDDLETGKAKDVSGKMTVKWRTKDLALWRESCEYHYRLLDKNIDVFVPGSKFL